MNPKGVNDLDPKLKETYERVMGTSLTPQQPAGQANVLPPEPSSPQPVLKTETVQNETPTASAPLPEPEMVASPQVFKAGDPFKDIDPPPSEVITNNAVVNTPKVKGKNKLMPVLLVVGGLVFFAIYAVVWAKVFGLF